jgi:hypothetical protein
MALAQEHMVAGPDAMVMRLFGNMSMIVVMMVIVIMATVIMGMTVIVTMQDVIVRHGAQSSALPL